MKHMLNETSNLMLVYKNSTATQAATLDCIAADYATIIVALGSAANTNAVGPSLALQSSDDTVVTNFATVVANVTQTITNINLRVYHVDQRAGKRYLRLLVTPATSTNDPITGSAVGILSIKEQAPSNTTAMVGSTNDAVTVV